MKPQAFENFARARPEGVILLIDTYDTEQGAQKVVALAPKLKADGIAIRGVRIDSGDLTAHARKVRAILDAGGLQDVIIVASGGINEDVLQTMMKEKAPIDGFGIGVNLAASVDAPALDCAYKLQEYAGKPKRKLSEGKATWPGRKQVWRAYDADGRMRGDILSLETDTQPGEALIVPVMRGGKRIGALADARADPRTRGARSQTSARAAARGSNRTSTIRCRSPTRSAPSPKRPTAKRERNATTNGVPRPRFIPPARAFAVDLMAGIGHRHGVFQFDEAARRVQQRGFHRHHHAGFQRPLGIARRIRHRPAVGEPRRLVADQPHAVGEEVDVIMVLRFRHQRPCGGVDFPPHGAGAHRLHRRALNALNFAQQSTSSASGSPWIAMRQTSPI